MPAGFQVELTRNHAVRLDVIGFNDAGAVGLGQFQDAGTCVGCVGE